MVGFVKCVTIWGFVTIWVADLFTMLFTHHRLLLENGLRGNFGLERAGEWWEWELQAWSQWRCAKSFGLMYYSRSSFIIQYQIGNGFQLCQLPIPIISLRTSWTNQPNVATDVTSLKHHLITSWLLSTLMTIILRFKLPHLSCCKFNDHKDSVLWVIQEPWWPFLAQTSFPISII